MKKALSKNPYARALLLPGFILYNNIKRLVTEGSDRAAYLKKIRGIIAAKEIILDIEFTGLGDWLLFTPLPRLLHEKYGIRTYVTRASVDRLRNRDIFRICFELNPYFCGIREMNAADNDSSSTVFRLNIFERDKSIKTILCDREGRNVIAELFRQFNINAPAKPEIHYVPKVLPEFSNVLLVDKNFVSGKKLGWHYDEELFTKHASLHAMTGSEISLVNPAAQDLFSYADMIASCKHFITTLSGGAALAASLDKEFTVILPRNVSGGSVDNFVFPDSRGTYVGKNGVR
jgi:hypothetical protein